MKYIIILGDGMADRPVASLGQRTPLQAARKPRMDQLARQGTTGLVKTIPDHLAPGSDTANMSVMGFDPQRFYTGRSPLEAISMSIDLRPGDVAFRTNLVTLSTEPDYASRTLLDYSADEITSEEAARLIDVLNDHFADDKFHFYAGKSYRHCLIWKQGQTAMHLVPPHDILTRVIGEYLPSGEGSGRLLAMMQESAIFLPAHPVNQDRMRRKLNPANAIWIWGQGTRPTLPVLSESYGLRGSVISAVDLIQGLGICLGLRVVEVPGATGNIHTNFRGKAEYAIREFERGQDYVYLHVEAPDECGHRAEVANKVAAIERIDEDIVAPVWDYLEQRRKATGEDYRILLLPDHPTRFPSEPIRPTRCPLPPTAATGFSGAARRPMTKTAAGNPPFFIKEGHTLFGRFVRGQIDGETG
jgi:2,3-bisphosphoglycerate-independent phosphoglycerate mutase